MKLEKVYRLWAGNVAVEVSEEVYSEYYTSLEREKYLDKIAKKRNYPLIYKDDGELSNDAIDSTEPTPEEILIAKENNSERQAQLKLLNNIFTTLTSDEQLLLTELFINNLSEREFSRLYGTPQKTINYRKRTLLMRLKKYFEENV